MRSRRETARIRLLQCEPQSRPTEIGRDGACSGHGRAIEQHSLDAYVIVKVFEMTNARRRASDSDVQCGCAVTRKGKLKCIRDSGRAQKACDTRAASGIRLQYVDRTGTTQAHEIAHVVAVLTGADRHAGRTTIAQ